MLNRQSGETSKSPGFQPVESLKPRKQPPARSLLPAQFEVQNPEGTSPQTETAQRQDRALPRSAFHDRRIHHDRFNRKTLTDRPPQIRETHPSLPTLTHNAHAKSEPHRVAQPQWLAAGWIFKSQILADGRRYSGVTRRSFWIESYFRPHRKVDVSSTLIPIRVYLRASAANISAGTETRRRSCEESYDRFL